ncbi:hypothetical protein K431DRAFT_296693 [Polychaeton citri CBS 116435]|uniref:Uncharacterized protein n=1 Tax=Polychaeton citri CBS 116435 TaxID=1314669 RepID=A0A9P4Q5U2_9PEZI|nr:hypothetical protein K431DRAFT_296693 [Polychaeton citri CBS 116435]
MCWSTTANGCLRFARIEGLDRFTPPYPEHSWAPCLTAVILEIASCVWKIPTFSVMIPSCSEWCLYRLSRPKVFVMLAGYCSGDVSGKVTVVEPKLIGIRRVETGRSKIQPYVVSHGTCLTGASPQGGVMGNQSLLNHATDCGFHHACALAVEHASYRRSRAIPIAGIGDPSSY